MPQIKQAVDLRRMAAEPPAQLSLRDPGILCSAINTGSLFLIHAKILLDFRHESGAEILAASMHRQLRPAAIFDDGDMSAAALVRFKCAAPPCQPAPQLARLHTTT